MSGLLIPSQVAPVPWANGAGATRELAAVRGAGGEMRWRVSVADLDRDACFSVLPGIDRLFVALGPLDLFVEGRRSALVAGDMVRFAGETAVAVHVDRPTRALNVMTRRGVFCGEVRLRDRAEGVSAGVDLTVDVGDRLADVLLTPEGQR